MGRWSRLGNGGGGSLSSYDPAARRWRQVRVDSANSRATFEGGMEDGAMVLTGRSSGYDGPAPNCLQA